MAWRGGGAPRNFQQSMLAKLLSFCIRCFRDPVGIHYEDVTGGKFLFDDLAFKAAE
jgi:hypothetical protein